MTTILPVIEVECSAPGLRESHRYHCLLEGLSEEEIERDWEQVQKDLADWEQELALRSSAAYEV